MPSLPATSSKEQDLASDKSPFLLMCTVEKQGFSLVRTPAGCGKAGREQMENMQTSQAPSLHQAPPPQGQFLPTLPTRGPSPSWSWCLLISLPLHMHLTLPSLPILPASSFSPRYRSLSPLSSVMGLTPPYSDVLPVCVWGRCQEQSALSLTGTPVQPCDRGSACHMSRPGLPVSWMETGSVVCGTDNIPKYRRCPTAWGGILNVLFLPEKVHFPFER